MFLSMHNWMCARTARGNDPAPGKIRYDSIEIGGEPDKYDTKEVSKLLKDNGLRCWGSVTLMFPGLDLIDANEQVRAKTVHTAKMSFGWSASWMAAKSPSFRPLSAKWCQWHLPNRNGRGALRD